MKSAKTILETFAQEFNDARNKVQEDLAFNKAYCGLRELMGKDREIKYCECDKKGHCGCWVYDYNQRGKEIRERLK